MSQQQSSDKPDRDKSPEAAHQLEATKGGTEGMGGSPGYGVNAGSSDPAPEQAEETGKRAPAADKKPGPGKD